MIGEGATLIRIIEFKLYIYIYEYGRFRANHTRAFVSDTLRADRVRFSSLDYSRNTQTFADTSADV